MNTSELITSINLRGSFPSDNYFSPAQYLSILNDHLKLDITPLLLKLNEEFFLTDKDYTISTAGASYRIPKRAIGAKLRDVKLLGSNGNITNLQRLYEEDRVSGASGYYLKRNSVELSSDIRTGTLRLSYFAAPSELVATTDCGQILSIDRDANQVELSAAPSTFVNGELMDLIQDNNPYDLLAMDTEIVGISGTTVTFNSIPDDLEVGDWVALAGQSPVALIPEELNPILVQAALCTLLAAKKDNSVQLELQKLEQMKAAATSMLDPRVESTDNKIRPTGILGFFRSR